MKSHSNHRQLSLLCAALFALPAWVQAQDYICTTNTGTITITGYTGSGGDVSIPSMINGLPVVCIGDAAFAGNNSLTNVTIANNITKIGVGAFSDCGSLNSVAISDSVSNIDNYAFFDCTSLTNVVIPSGVITIGSGSFKLCASLTGLTIGNNVITIGSEAFSYCYALTSVTIPYSVSNIGIKAFAGSASLQTITVNPLNSVYCSVDGVVFNKSQTSLVLCPAGKFGNYTVSNIVIRIEDSAFEACNSLATLTIPNSVTNIGSFAFHLCTYLTTITVDPLNAYYSSVDGVFLQQRSEYSHSISRRQIRKLQSPEQRCQHW